MDNGGIILGVRRIILGLRFLEAALAMLPTSSQGLPMSSQGPGIDKGAGVYAVINHSSALNFRPTYFELQLQ